MKIEFSDNEILVLRDLLVYGNAGKENALITATVRNRVKTAAYAFEKQSEKK